MWVQPHPHEQGDAKNHSYPLEDQTGQFLKPQYQPKAEPAFSDHQQGPSANPAAAGNTQRQSINIELAYLHVSYPKSRVPQHLFSWSSELIYHLQ